MYQRFGWNPEIRYEPYWWKNIAVLRKPARIFVGSTMELFGDWINYDWLDAILASCRKMYWHTFIFLTKRPENLIKWSPFPDNCWGGVTATDATSFSKATDGLMHVKATVKFISIEPLLGPVRFYPERLPYCGINWIILGQQTPVTKATRPKVEWIRETVQAADQAGVKVFLKDNLAPVLRDHPEFWDDIPQGDHPNYESISELRQDFPSEDCPR